MVRFTPPTKWRFRNRLLLMLALFGYAFAGPYFAPWWEMLDIDPTPTVTLGFLGTWGSLVCWMLLLVWLLFFSYVPFRWRMVLLVGFLAYFATIDDIQLNSYRQPVLHYRWQSRPDEALTSYLKEQPAAAEQGPAVDLRIDPVNDYPRFRGPRCDGVVNPAALLDLHWEKKQPRKVWQHPCGGGFAGFAVAGNVAITLEQRGDQETVACYDRQAGTQRWAYGYAASFRHISGHGPRATPTLAEGRVYSLGALGHLVCVDGKTGEPLWRRNILEDGQAKLASWGMAGSPLVVDGLVIVNAGIDPAANAGRAVVAYRTGDGTVAWAAGDTPAGYSSPMLATLAGKRQVVLFDNGGVAGYDLEGKGVLWRYPWLSETDGNVTQPVFFPGDRLLISSETNKGCAMLRVARTADGFGVEKLWGNKNLCSRYANPVGLGAAVFGLSSGYAVCLDAQTGKRLWRGRRCYNNGQMLGVSGALMVQSEDGEVVVIPADARKLTVWSAMKVFDERVWNTPALAGRYLYLRNDVEMACYELPLRE